MKEQNIIIGLITSTDYLDRVAPTFDYNLLESSPAKLLAKWSIEHYTKFRAAPRVLIQDVFMRKVKEGKVPPDLAEEIQDDILPALSDKYSRSVENVNYLVKRTEKYFAAQRITKLAEEAQSLLDKGEVDAAEKLIRKHQETKDDSEAIDFKGRDVEERIRKAFKVNNNSVLWYPGALGEFWNDSMMRGNFIGIMAPEKRGKTFLLLDMAMRGVRQGSKVAFFQAGDMTEGQQLRRTGIYLARRSDKDKYCRKGFIPVKDCIYNQMDTCEKQEREEDFGIFPHLNREEIKKLTIDDLKEAYKEDPNYRPCYNCDEWRNNHLGVPWIKTLRKQNPLEEDDAVKITIDYFKRHSGNIKMSSHANGTLSVSMIKSILNTWRIKDKFTADIILIDYADLLVPDTKEFRHGQNEVWKDLRGLSQAEDSLVVAPTQTDSKSYEQDTLTLSNFSEDKRKFAHVTAMYGLNQSKDRREKKIGIMRINELLVREGDAESNGQVSVLGKLQIGRPILTSYWGA